MNILRLAQNVARSIEVCPTWHDRLSRVAWLYDLAPGRSPSPSRDRSIDFRYDAPIGDISMLVRDNGGADAFVFSEVFDHRYYDLALPFSPESILDAGANAGFATVFLGRKYPNARIASIEPFPDNVRLLAENARRNGVRTEVVAKALVERDGVVELRLSANDWGHKIPCGVQTAPPESPRLRVEGVSVPTLLRRLGWDGIGLLKVDVEGYEQVLLRQNTDWLGRVEALAIECHAGFGEEDLQDIATRYGFGQPIDQRGIWLLVRERRRG